MLLGDLRYAARRLLASPGYALTCIAVLALGIGANAAIFSVVRSVILKGLPYNDPARLVFVWERVPNMPDPPGGRITPARRNYLEWKRQNTVFADMAAYEEKSLTESGADHPKHISVGFASANLFPLLGVKARMGRLLTAEEERAGADRVAILSDFYFEEHFGRDRTAIGKSVSLADTAYTVIGVLPPTFHLPATWEGMDQKKPVIWIPLSRLWKTADDDTQRQLFVMARLKPHVSLAQARAEMTTIADRLAKVDPKLDEGWSAAVHLLEVEDTSPTLHVALYVLLGAVGFLLLIACANLANLTLARATLRSREIAVRLALGATRARVVVELVAESLLVSITGAALGLLLAHWCIRLMLALQPPEIQRPELITIDFAVFAFTAAASVLTTLLFGLAPAIAVSRADLNSALKSGGSGGASAARARSRQTLIAIEVTLALMLVSGSGLMIRSLREIVVTGIGFDTAQLTTLDIDLDEKRYPENRRSAFFRELIARARAIPGTADAAVVDNLPLHSVMISGFYFEGRPDPDPPSVADFANVSPEFFRVLGLRLLAGRFFTDADLALTEKEQNVVAIVNQAFVRQYFDGHEAVGKRLLSGDKKHLSEIVGVVSDYRPMGVEVGTRPQIFWPYLKKKTATLIVRSRGAPQLLTTGIQTAIWSLDKELPANKIQTMGEHLNEWQSQRKFNTLLMAIFASLALVLAMMGIYGVLSNLVASRVREIGIRMAIGASPAGIGRLIVSQSMIPVVIGLAAGVAGSVALSRFLETLLFQVRARDPLTLTAAALAILLISPIAIYAPLRRAIRVDCTIALREE